MRSVTRIRSRGEGRSPSPIKACQLTHVWLGLGTRSGRGGA